MRRVSHKSKRYQPNIINKSKSNVHFECNRRAAVYLEKLSGLVLAEQDKETYLNYRAITQFEQAHLIAMFQLLRKYNAIKLTEVI